ncbi:hypothetical protein ACFL7D_05255 [candidate division KSB1 bacterium]
MEKELERFENLEDQFEKLAELVIKLKEENKQLHSQNEQLLIQIDSTNENKFQDSGKQKSTETINSNLISKEETNLIRQNVKSALKKLEELSETVNSEI